MRADPLRNVVSAPMRALIVDDEALARRGLRLRLDNIAGVDIMGECNNGREALACIARDTPDLVFLDIQMPGLSGFDVVRELQSDSMPLIVFVTAFDQYAVNAFEVHAVDYLLKPVEQPRLEEAVSRARSMAEALRAADQKGRLMNLIVSMTGHTESTIESLAEQRKDVYPQRLTIRDGDDTTLVPVGDIEWIDAAGDYMCIHVKNKTHVMRVTMKQLEALLDPALFLRVHRSTLINAQRVASLTAHDNGEFFITLSQGARLKVSRGYRDKVARFL
jgi:two-component system, LytTR family, response regulator